MTATVAGKIQTRHLRRRAYLYVRQSTLRQVIENTESTDRQYALKQRATALGWTAESITVIDSDLGQSGASAADRKGFQTLVTEVGLGRAGIVMGLEVSRLARNSTDWHRLLELCALTDTLILDEDGVYDPAHFNDRLLLGLKGTMSEAELHVLRARLQGGILNKARRAELRMRLPIGLVYDDNGHVELDPDQQVQGAVRLLFQTFRRTGSASATVKASRASGQLFPRRPYRTGGEILWCALDHSQALRILHNPRYAGVFFYGSSRQRMLPNGDVHFERLPRDEWAVFAPGAHVGYISWEEFEENQRQLRENAAAHGEERRKSPPREGPALLQGIALCGKCGERMTVRYHSRQGSHVPQYVCQREGVEQAKPICQSIPGASIDRAVGELLIEAVSPLAIAVTVAVQHELQACLEEADAQRKKRVERCEYDAEQARRRFMRVDPDNRLVATSLEAEWNEKLRAVAEAREVYEQQRLKDRLHLDDRKTAELKALATDVPRLWHDCETPDRERKRMIRLLIEDVTLQKDEDILLQVRFRGGATKTLHLPPPLPSWKSWQTSPTVIAEVDALLNDHTEAEAAEILNQRGYRSGKGKKLHRFIVRRLRREYGLRNRYERLRDQGFLSRDEVAKKLGVSPTTVTRWRLHGLLLGSPYEGKKRFLYKPSETKPPRGHRGQRLAERLAERPQADEGGAV